MKLPKTLSSVVLAGILLMQVQQSNAATGADFSIQKSGPSSVVRGNTVVYTVTIFNAGPMTGNNVVIADAIPAGLTFDSSQSSPNCLQNGVNILCDNMTLNSGDSATVTIAFNVPTVSNCTLTTIHNHASVSTSTTDPNSANNQSQTVSTTVTCPPAGADLSVTKSGPSSVERGDIAYYSVTAFNAGPTTATNVKITDPIPAGLTFNASQSSPNCVQSGLNIVCTDPSLGNGQNTTFTIAFNVPTTTHCTQTTVNNKATVSSSVTDPNSGNNTSQTIQTTLTCPIISADLSIAKSGPAFVVRGSVIAYTVTAFNAGPSTATTVVITDPIPSGLTFNPSQSSSNCIHSGANIVCTIPSITNGQNSTVTIAFTTATMTNCTEVTVSNTATVSAATTDANPGNNQSNVAETTVTCPLSADLSILKSGPTSVARGGVVSYTLTASNAGPSAANNVTITDPIPAGFTFNASQSSGNCAPSGSNIVCTNPSIANGQSTTVTIAFNVPTMTSCVQTTVNNTATVASSCTDPNPSNNTSNTVATTLTCPVVQADLSIQKSGPASVTRGGVAVYHLNIFNAGPSTAVNVTVTDAIPTGLTFNAGQSSNSCSQIGTNIVCTNFNLSSGQSTILPIAFNVPTISSCTPTTVSNHAIISSSTTDPNLSNNTSQIVQTTLTCPNITADLSIVKSGPSSVVRGSVLSYTVTATNAGPSAATNVVINDPIPSGLTFNAGASSSNCSQNGSNIVCNAATLGSGQSTTVTIAFNVPTITNCTQTTVNNTATVSSSTGDPNTSNNTSATIQTTITCPSITADLSIVKSGSSSVLRGGIAYYTLTVTNAGPGTATSIVITDPIPSGLNFNTGISSSSCTQNGSNIQCNIASLANGQSTSVTLAFNVPTMTSCVQTIVTNNATVSSATTDPNTSNNTSATIQTTLTCPITNADLAIVKTGTSTVLRGGIATYTLTVTNLGPATATSVVITDPIPSGLNFNSSLSSSNCSQNGSNILCTVATLTNGQSTTVTLAFNVPTISNCTQTIVTNNATVSNATTDPNLSNNTSQTIQTTLTCPPTGGTVTIYKTDNRSTATAGDTLHYQIILTNSASSAATNLTVTDSVPQGLTILTVSNSGIVSGQNVTWNNVTVGANTSLTITLDAQVRSDVLNNTVVHNTATVNSQTATDDTTIQNHIYEPPYYPPTYPPYFPPVYTPPPPPVFTPPTPPVFYPPVVVPQTGTNNTQFYASLTDTSHLTVAKKGQKNSEGSAHSSFPGLLYSMLVSLIGVASAAASKLLPKLFA